MSFEHLATLVLVLLSGELLRRRGFLIALASGVLFGFSEASIRWGFGQRGGIDPEDPADFVVGILFLVSIWLSALRIGRAIRRDRGVPATRSVGWLLLALVPVEAIALGIWWPDR